jgi:hypothetical protein
MSAIARLACLLCVLAPQLAAQPLGIAFVEAPEQSSGMSMAGDPAKAFALATEGCVEGGALAQDCLPTAWCLPAGWTVDIFQQHREGPHWHSIHCGLPDRDTALAVAEVICRAGLAEWLMECAPVRLWDPEGSQVDIEPAP